MLNGELSSVVRQRGWADRFAPLTRAWDDIGELKREFRPAAFSGRGRILCGVHDSDANYLRYLAAGFDELALLSTGTFIIGFESQTDILRLDPHRETFSFTNVFGQPIGCCGFFGGGEFDKLLAGASPSAASAADVEAIIAHSVFALPSFSDTGGPVAGSGNRGRIEGPFSGALAQRASLATLYTALMTSEALDAVESRSPIVIDGPFARNDLFCSLLGGVAAAPTRRLVAAAGRDGRRRRRARSDEPRRRSAGVCGRAESARARSVRRSARLPVPVAGQSARRGAMTNRKPREAAQSGVRAFSILLASRHGRA